MVRVEPCEVSQKLKMAMATEKESWEEELEKTGNTMKWYACEECDSIIACNCLKERLAKIAADHRKERENQIAQLKKTGCTCTKEMLESEEEDICEFCEMMYAMYEEAEEEEEEPCGGCGRVGECWCAEDEDEEDEYDRKDREYRQWKADQHKYGP